MRGEEAVAGLLEKEPRQTETGSEAERGDSLVRQAARFEGRSARSDDRAACGDGGADLNTAPFADGYVRRSPVQPVRISASYLRRRRRRRIGLIVFGAVLIVLIRILIGAGVLTF